MSASTHAYADDVVVNARIEFIRDRAARLDDHGWSVFIQKLDELQRPTPTWRPTTDRALRLAERKAPRIPTGFTTLDAALRGGLKAKTVTVVQGAPGAGKTTLVVDLAARLVRAGLDVAVVAADEDADGLLIRVGQGLGLDRDRLDDGDQDACLGLAQSLERGLPRLHVLDAEEEACTVESVAEGLSERANGNQTVIIYDSIQTIATEDALAADPPRARVDKVMKALKKVAKKGHIVIVTSEVSRGFYRPKNKDEQIDDLAAGKESGGIEFGAHTLLVLRSVKGENGVVDVTMPKNRCGKKLAFRLAQNFDRATFLEIPMPAETDGGDEDEKLNLARQRVLRALKRSTKLCSKNDVSKAATGNRQYNLAAISELLDEGAIVQLNGAFRVKPEVT